MAGILLNVCFGALFYDPVEKHLKKVLVEREPVGETKEKEPEKLTTSPEKPKKSEFLEIQVRDDCLFRVVSSCLLMYSLGRLVGATWLLLCS